MHAAVFVDFENLFLSLKNREELSGQRIRDLCLSILENLKARLQTDKAPMVLMPVRSAPTAWLMSCAATLPTSMPAIMCGTRGRNWRAATQASTVITAVAVT